NSNHVLNKFFFGIISMNSLLSVVNKTFFKPKLNNRNDEDDYKQHNAGSRSNTVIKFGIELFIQVIYNCNRRFGWSRLPVEQGVYFIKHFEIINNRNN